MYKGCFLERGSRAFIRFRKEYVISRKAQNYCFQGTCTHLVFRLESTAPWVTHRNRPWRPSEKPTRGFLQGPQGNKGARLGFTSLLVRSFYLAIIPKTSFKKKGRKELRLPHPKHTCSYLFGSATEGMLYIPQFNTKLKIPSFFREWNEVSKNPRISDFKKGPPSSRIKRPWQS